MAGATRIAICTPEDAKAVIKRAAGMRAVEATAMNAESSRSHSVFMLHITGQHAGSNTHLQGALNLVDLAGRQATDSSLPMHGCTYQSAPCSGQKHCGIAFSRLFNIRCLSSGAPWDAFAHMIAAAAASHPCGCGMRDADAPSG